MNMREGEGIPLVEGLERLSLDHALRRSAERYADRPAFSFVGGEALTYAALNDAVGRFASLLAARGIVPGDRVALLGENRPQWPVAYFGIIRAGAVVVPILPDFHPTDIVNILTHSESKLLVMSRRSGERLGPQAPSCDVLELDDADTRPAREGHVPHQGCGTGPDDLAAVIYTSGTTGSSKGVMLTHRNILGNALATLERVPTSPDDVMLSILPLSHTYECTLGMVTPLIAGASVFYLNRPPVASVLLPALTKVRPTMILSVPLVIEKVYRTRIQPRLRKPPLRTLARIPRIRRLLARAAGKKLLDSFGGRLRFFGVGGAAMAPDVERFLRDAGFPYAVGYGLTETSPLIAGTGPEITRYRSTGPPLEGVELRIADPDPKTGEGEIQVRGPYVMRGYFRDPERTREAFTEDGWFRTGDLGALDRDGYLFIRGRLKNMILGPSGENIYPEEIEAAINRFPGVADSLVLERKGTLVALVQLNYEELEKRLEGIAAGIADRREKAMEFLDRLRKDVNAGLSQFSRITRMDEQETPFEKTPTNKIKRYLYLKDRKPGRS